MKRILTMGILGMLVLCLMASSAFAAEAAANPAYNEESMVTVTGKQVKLENVEELVGVGGFLGFAFAPPAAWGQLKNDTLAFLHQEDDSIYMDYLPEAHKELIEKMARTADDDEWGNLYAEIENRSLRALCVFRVNPNEEATLANEANLRKDYSNVSAIAKNGEDVYYLGYNDGFDSKDLSANDLADLAKLAEGRTEISDGLMIFPKVVFDFDMEDGYEEPDLVCNLSSFTAKDLEGNTFTQADLAKYDLTMINVWATYCGPCLAEMGDLAKLKGMLPANANMITICSDASEDMDLAKDIVKSVKATFTTLVNNEELNKLLLNNVLAVPTTLFVDKDGRMVGKHIVGAPDGDVAQGYLDMINERLEQVK